MNHIRYFLTGLIVFGIIAGLCLGFAWLVDKGFGFHALAGLILMGAYGLGKRINQN